MPHHPRAPRALVAVLGAAPVLYHSVATLYEGLFVVLAAVIALPYLFYPRRRRDARVVRGRAGGADRARHRLRPLHLQPRPAR